LDPKGGFASARQGSRILPKKTTLDCCFGMARTVLGPSESKVALCFPTRRPLRRPQILGAPSRAFKGSCSSSRTGMRFARLIRRGSPLTSQNSTPEISRHLYAMRP
jgi:hypothetical protein